MNELTVLWEGHRQSDWPRFTSPHQGELMTLDTVIAGCITYHLESSNGLDPQRLAILENCRDELSALLPDIPDAAKPYFGRLLALASLLRHAQP